jgi:alpha-tubulin suppressor-like RCC1 family protein
MSLVSEDLDQMILPLKAVSVACGQYSSLVLLEDGSVWGCGGNTYGQLGNDDGVDIYIPVNLELPSPVTSISSGLYHSLFLLENGDFYSCGLNKKGVLGVGLAYVVNLPPTRMV